LPFTEEWLPSGFIRPERRIVVVPNVFHLRMMEATVLLGTFDAAE
jgi:hypothetical protein